MTEREIKRWLEDNGLRIVDVAKDMAFDFPIAKSSAETMLRDLVAGRRWFPVYADWLQRKYGIKVDKPEWLKPVRERMRIVA